MAVVLYRKYRPKNFKEVLGQDHVVQVLKGALENGRISHAYLFSGPRGTGKTSIARILAENIGCHEYDMSEIDAASARGIDDIRELRDAVYTMPLRGNKKVYIIDEVHMLTREAFNALLKTLEEPPEHVVFMLATTEPQKLPDTITSRCQHFALRKQPENVLKSTVKDIAKREGVSIDDEGAGLIALFADGSFRDAYTMLEQVMGVEDKKITGEEVRKFLQAPDKKMIQDFTEVLVLKDAEKGVEFIQEIVERGIDIQLFLKFVLRDIRSLLLLKLKAQNKNKEIDYLSKNIDNVSVSDLGYILLTLLDTYDNVGRAYMPHLPLELALAKIHIREEKKKDK